MSHNSKTIPIFLFLTDNHSVDYSLYTYYMVVKCITKRQSKLFLGKPKAIKFFSLLGKTKAFSSRMFMIVLPNCFTCFWSIMLQIPWKRFLFMFRRTDLPRQFHLVTKVHWKLKEVKKHLNLLKTHHRYLHARQC